MSEDTITGVVLMTVALACLVVALALRRRSRWSLFFTFFAGYVTAEALALVTR
jgi:hypothetical protein